MLSSAWKQQLKEGGVYVKSRSRMLERGLVSSLSSYLAAKRLLPLSLAATVSLAGQPSRSMKGPYKLSVERSLG